jgi:hypothetical protein
MDTAIIFQIQSFLIMSLIIYGATQAKKRNRHIKIMSTAIAWDILLILQIELTRSAIKKASEAITNPMMLNIHVSIAVSTVLLYFFMIYSGRKVLKGEATFTSKHKRVGQLTIIMRILTFVTSFWAA